MNPWEFDRRGVDVIAIGSQLVYGSVGNNAAAGEFARAGLRRVTVPTVILSNLPHYPSVHAVDIPNTWLTQALDDLIARGVLSSIRFITIGFLASPEQARIISLWLTRVRDLFPNITVILDPTMGDDDVGIYTAPGLAQAHLEYLLPLAHGLVPNRFELELLAAAAQWSTQDLDVVHTASRLLELGPDWAVVTSAETGSQDLVFDTVITESTTTTLEHPRVETAAKGAGDHFAASLLIALAQSMDLIDCVKQASQRVADQLRDQAD